MMLDGGIAGALVFLLLGATAGSMLELLFIFIDRGGVLAL
jgi:hypothetical protein